MKCNLTTGTIEKGAHASPLSFMQAAKGTIMIVSLKRLMIPLQARHTLNTCIFKANGSQLSSLSR